MRLKVKAVYRSRAVTEHVKASFPCDFGVKLPDGARGSVSRVCKVREALVKAESVQFIKGLYLHVCLSSYLKEFRDRELFMMLNKFKRNGMNSLDVGSNVLA